MSYEHDSLGIEKMPVAGSTRRARLHEGLKRWSAQISSTYDRTLYWLFGPSRRLSGILADAQYQIEARKAEARWPRSVGLWFLIQGLRLAQWIVQWTFIALIMGPILFVYLMAFIFLWVGLVVKPIVYTQWVGGAWLVALVGWSVLRNLRSPWWRSLGGINLGVVIGLTPQLLFLLVYNGFKDVEIPPPEFIETAIKNYERFAVSIHTGLSSVSHVAWYWWALAGYGLLLTCWLLEQPKILSGALKLRRMLVAAIFIVSVTTSLGLSSSAPVGNWEPDIQVRLHGVLKENLKVEAEINLANSLATWFADHPTVQTALPHYAQNFEEARVEAGKAVEGQPPAREDVRRGVRAAMKDLVPTEIAAASLGEPTTTGARSARVSGTVPELLSLESEMRQKNDVLKARADQARATTVAIIAQTVEVSVSSVPMLREIVGEMINATAERLSEHFVAKVPIEEGAKAIRTAGETVKKAIAANTEALVAGVFGLAAGTRAVLNGADVRSVRERVAKEVRTAQAARVARQNRPRPRGR